MDKTLEFYKQSVKRLLREYEELSTAHSEVKLLFDDEHLNYMAVRVGWHNRKHIHLCLVHIEIEHSKIIIHCNNTEDLIASELEEMGVPRQAICVGFLPPEIQSFLTHHPQYQELQPV